MKEYVLVLKILIKSKFQAYRQKYGKVIGFRGLDAAAKRQLNYTALVALAFIPLLALLAFVGYMMGSIALSSHLQGEFLTSLIAMSQLITFFFGAAAIVSVMFISSDNEFLLALPLRSNSIFFAKLTVVYLSELAVAAFCLMPSLIAFGVALRLSPAAAALYFLSIPLAVLTAPMLPLLILTVLSFPLMRIVAYLKRRSGFATLIILFLTLISLGIYFAIVIGAQGFLSGNGEGAVVSGQVAAFMRTLADIVYPYKAVSFFMLNIRPAANFGIFIAIVAAAFIVSAIIAKLTYRKSVAAQLESSGGSKNTEYKAAERPLVISLLVKDFKCLLRNPGFAINSFLNIFMAPLLLLVLMLASGGGLTMTLSTESIEANGEMMSLGMVSMYVVVLSCGMNYIAFLSFTREGKSYYFNRCLPLDYKTVIKSKKLFADLDSVIGLVLVAIVAVVVAKIHIINALIMFVNMLIFAKAFNAWGIYRDMKRPNFNWQNATEAIKRNYYVAVPMFLAIGVGFVLLIISIMVMMFGGVLGEIGQYAVYWAASFALAIAMLIAFNLQINTKGEQLFYKMGDI
ncbi:MAG: hypothetical protein ACOYIN_00990 [Christensenellales bacterium]|jgi:ABC-2 type transport system permease protein